MPADALPVPWPTAVDGAAHYRREYRDVLGRPMRGKVTLTGSARTEAGGVVVTPTPVHVELVDGVLEVNLPPDTYRLAATLRTVDGERGSDADTVTLNDTTSATYAAAVALIAARAGNGNP